MNESVEATNSAYTIGKLADELGMGFRKLLPVFKRLKSRNLAIGRLTFSIKEVTLAIKFFSKDKALSEHLYHFILGQYAASKELVTLDQIAASNYLQLKELKIFCTKIDRNERWLFLEPNVFVRNANDGIRRTMVEDFVSAFLKYKISLNRITSCYVPTFGKKEDSSEEFMRVTLLDSVQDETWRKGTIVGFYQHKGEPTLPIVAYRKGTIQVVPKIKMFPKTIKSIDFKSRNTKRQPIIFTIRVNSLLSDEQDAKNKFHYFHSLNMLVESIKKNGIGVSVRSAGTYKSPYIELIAETTTINLKNFQVTADFTKKAKKTL